MEKPLEIKEDPPPLRRESRAKRSVLIADALMDRVVRFGGAFVIVAVLGMLVFLVSETVPLFMGGKVTAEYGYQLGKKPGPILTTILDEYKTIGAVIDRHGRVIPFHARTGTPLQAPPSLFKDKELTAFAKSLNRKDLVFALEDGSLRFARVEFKNQIVPEDGLPKGLNRLDKTDLTDGIAIYREIPGKQFRRVSFGVILEEEQRPFPSGRSVEAIAYRVRGEAERQTRAYVVATDDGTLVLSLLRSKINLLTGERRTSVKKVKLPPLPAGIKVKEILLTQNADAVLVAGERGKVVRYNINDPKEPKLAEIAQVTAPGSRLNIIGFLRGDQSIVVGGSEGSLEIFFLVKREDAGTIDGQSLVVARHFEKKRPAPVLLGQALLGKTFAVAGEWGALEVFHSTSQKTLLRFSGNEGAMFEDILLAPRVDGLIAVDRSGGVRLWEYSVPHPETTLGTLFRKVWYEGFRGPTYTWQSSAGTDDFEPKLSLIPLIFGTVKAAFYSLLFAIPIAVLGAIYTSEFIDQRLRSIVKPAMEMMASLPSVVLGFVAALVMAPFVETWISAVLLVFLVIPASLALSAYLWQFLPQGLGLRWKGLPKFLFICLVTVLSLYLSFIFGKWLEAAFFYADFKAWLNKDVGGPGPFLFLLGLPFSFCLLGAFLSRFFGRAIAQRMRSAVGWKAPALDLLRWLLLVVASCGVSLALSRLLGELGVDARGAFVGTYVQRNALIVGFAMGFAVIPIIYTIAEDALNAVPEHLRAASLACGATQWQTTLHVVVPAAVSGIFSAIMIGMGRAVGETMIVVMAAGNTPIIDWNVFNGLRAMSATIAVELPEAVKDGTLYRVLFLAGLVLFVMTFVINTAAELVRLRFRKRSTQL